MVEQNLNLKPNQNQCEAESLPKAESQLGWSRISTCSRIRIRVKQKFYLKPNQNQGGAESLSEAMNQNKSKAESLPEAESE